MTLEDLLRSICQNRCSAFGDPACYEVVEGTDTEWTPCGPCEEDAGLDPRPEPLDPDAVVRPLL